MPARRVLIGTLLALALVGTMYWTVGASRNVSSLDRSVMWIGFLTGSPILLIGALWIAGRWVLMAIVVYGTVGLALDLATIIQRLQEPLDLSLSFALVLGSGILNGVLIVAGGQGFLDFNRVSSLPGGRPPNPPFPSSS